MLRAIAAAKNKNDRIDAGKIANCLRCDFFPECHMVSTEIPDRRRALRYRHLLVHHNPGVGGLRSWRFSLTIKKEAWNQLLRRGGDLGRDYQHRKRLGNDDDNTDPAHFLRILSMAFPLASSSTNLSR
jgi:hypothetical protein